MAQKDVLDRFYTDNAIAADCISFVEHLVGGFDRFDAVIEPSAGGGAFSDRLPTDRFAFDISPSQHSHGIVAKDWFQVWRDDFADSSRLLNELLVIGNPPFGTRSSLAKKFILHSIELGATTIAFILPDVFSKMSNQKCFPADWRLVAVEHLPRNAFILDGESYHVPCSFFVWTKTDDIASSMDLREYPVEQPIEFSYLPREDKTADFTVNGNNGRVKDLYMITNPKAEHYIKVSNGFPVNEIRHKFEQLVFDFKSSANGGVAWVNRDDINRAWQNIYGDSV